jgi:threonine/homoserine/homoserine lactone efflux protein
VELYLAIFLFALSAGITPGPNNIMLMSSGMNFGIKRSLPHVAGVCIGFTLMVILVGLGFSVIFERFPILHEVIKVLGLVYLLYLSWLIANAAPSELDNEKSKPFSFIQAALFQWINPKAWVMATGAISAFTSLNSDIHWQVLLIASFFFIAAIISSTSWLVFGKSLKRLLKNIKQQKIFNISMALLLVASMVPVMQELAQQYLLSTQS